MELSDCSWTCLDESAGVWGRSYTFNKSGGTANCVVIRLRDDDLMVISPPTNTSGTDFAALDELGKVVALVAPNGLHHLGLPDWSARYPEAGLFASPAAGARIAKQAPGLKSFGSLDALAKLLPDNIEVFDGQDLKRPDLFARVGTAEGTIWYSNDVIGNSPVLPSNFLIAKLFQWTRSGPGYTVNRLVLKYFKPGPAFAPWLKAEFEKHPPKMVVPGHGDACCEGDMPAKTRAILEAGL